jgi:hypothetical protein
MTSQLAIVGPDTEALAESVLVALFTVMAILGIIAAVATA